MKIEYAEIDTLEHIVDIASNEIPDGTSSINYVMPFSITIGVIKEKPLKDVTDEARLWAMKNRPEELHINHGEFIGDGLDQMISQLSNNKTSNRALISLIDQKVIANSGDNPIPSFMLLQCNIHEDTLYCTAYFRALEVTTFLRVNLEEIRLKIVAIHDSLQNFKNIKLTIFAFRAYSNKNINTLKIPIIDRLSEAKIFSTLSKNPKEISDLLKEKRKDSTVVVTTSLERIISCLEELDDGAVAFNRKLALSTTRTILEIAIDLKEKRSINSHHEDFGEMNKTLSEKTLELSKVIYNA
ncbi:hypothetical protein [Pseudomonas sp. efr-133-TYG-103a]|uniref:hypothetical protein n=1 Tax=Pseudomonas sp. efr-133-TYG-103a TaxID=3040308 RepID=UPI00255779BF|nr:hypothetical protein [Pseudomonas sp. efr-133-TYG-103a]